MNTVETQIAEIAAWFKASSKDSVSPLGDPIIPGPFATIINVGINDVGHFDYSALVAQGVLPILTPQAVSVAVDLTPPQVQFKVAERAYHILWKIEQGHIPKVAVVGLLTTGTSIQSALNAAGLGSLDVTARGVLALPLYAFSDVQIERVWEKLPLI